MNILLTDLLYYYYIVSDALDDSIVVTLKRLAG